MNKWAEEIRKTRRELRIPLSDVAEAAGISIPYVSNLEQGRKQPPAPNVVMKIAGVLGRDVDRDLQLAAAARKAVEFAVPDGDELRARAAAVLARAWDDNDALRAAIDAAERKG